MPTQNRDFLTVGLTGGIGSGKSTVAALFTKLGRTVLSADKIARDLTESDSEVRRDISAAFGPDTYKPDGPLDRKRLASIVFTSPPLRKRLDAIVHPRVFTALDAIIGGLPPERRRPYVLIEAALIYESGHDRRLDYVIVVHAAAESRISRIMKRDGCTREEVIQRIHSQMAAERKVTLADFVIENERNSTLLEEKVAFIDALLSSI